MKHITPYADSVPHITHSNSSSIWKIVEFHTSKDQNPQMLVYAGIKFTNFIYTKSTTFPSRAKCQCSDNLGTFSIIIYYTSWIGPAAACYGQNARRGSLSPRCDLMHRFAAGGGAKSRQAQLQILRLLPLLWVPARRGPSQGQACPRGNGGIFQTGMLRNGFWAVDFWYFHQKKGCIFPAFRIQ